MPTRSTKLPPDIEAALRAWDAEDRGTSDDSIRRLRKNLRRAIQEDLTDRQREMLLIYLSVNCSQVKVARQLMVNRSTVSRTIGRAMVRLERVLRYSF